MNAEEKKSILVNGEAVPEALVEQEYQMLFERYSAEMPPMELQQKDDKIRSDARENAVERLLLTQKAREEIASVRPEEIEARFMGIQEQHGGEEAFARQFELGEDGEQQVKADIADGIRLEKYFDLICKEVPRPAEADSQAYYDAHTNEFITPEMVHAAHIVQHPTPENPTERVYAELLNVRERLKGGEDFNVLAQEVSHCQDGGQDLGWFGRGQMVQTFEDVAFSTPVGEYSDVFQTEFGYHILKVFDHRPEEQQSFVEVRYDIESMLYDEWKNEAIGKVADELREKAQIENLEIVGE